MRLMIKESNGVSTENMTISFKDRVIAKDCNELSMVQKIEFAFMANMPFLENFIDMYFLLFTKKIDGVVTPKHIKKCLDELVNILNTEHSDAYKRQGGLKFIDGGLQFDDIKVTVSNAKRESIRRRSYRRFR